MGEERRYSLRKRKAPSPSTDDQALDKLLAVASTCSNMVLFTGSGLSASSGMSTFSTPGGLYERAQKQFGLQDGKKLFCYSFFDRQRLDVQPFFADIYDEALSARAAPGHRAIAAIHRAGKLLRHYTLNIDGLAADVGMDTWHPDNNPDGVTVEMHGSIQQLVCPACDVVCGITDEHLILLRAKQALPCGACGQGVLRWRVMMYDDAESESITPEGVMDVLDTDMETADCVLWIGLSFEQSATTSYFRRVRSALSSAGRFSQVPQFLINPSDEALWNLLSSCSNQGEVEVHAITASSDKILPKVAKIAKASPARQANHDTTPQPASTQQKGETTTTPVTVKEAPALVAPVAITKKEEEDEARENEARENTPQPQPQQQQQPQQHQVATKPSTSQQPGPFPVPPQAAALAALLQQQPPPPQAAVVAALMQQQQHAAAAAAAQGLHQFLTPLAVAPPQGVPVPPPAPMLPPIPIPGFVQQPYKQPAAALALYQQLLAAQQVLAAAGGAYGGGAYGGGAYGGGAYGGGAYGGGGPEGEGGLGGKAQGDKGEQG